MTEAEWDAVIQVHLKGTFGPSRHAAAYWRERSKAGEERRRPHHQHDVAVGHLRQRRPDQLRRGQGRASPRSRSSPPRSWPAYGVTVNAIAPAALTRMTENLGMGQADDEIKEKMSPRWIAPIVTWLASAESTDGHRPGVRRHRPGAVGRRGLAPRPDREARRRPRPHRRDRHPARRRRPSQRQHDRLRRDLTRSILAALVLTSIRRLSRSAELATVAPRSHDEGEPHADQP